MDTESTAKGGTSRPVTNGDVLRAFVKAVRKEHAIRDARRATGRGIALFGRLLQAFGTTIETLSLAPAKTDPRRDP